VLNSLAIPGNFVVSVHKSDVNIIPQSVITSF